MCCMKSVRSLWVILEEREVVLIFLLSGFPIPFLLLFGSIFNNLEIKRYNIGARPIDALSTSAHVSSLQPFPFKLLPDVN